MAIKTWQHRMVENAHIPDLYAQRIAKIALMQNEINDLRAYLPADSGMWRDVAQELQKKYEALLQGAPESAWISVDERLPNVEANSRYSFLVYCELSDEENMQIAMYFNNVKGFDKKGNKALKNQETILTGWFLLDLDESGYEYYRNIEDEKVTHWMPLLAPPKETK